MCFLLQMRQRVKGAERLDSWWPGEGSFGVMVVMVCMWLCILAPAASVGVLVAFGRWRLLQERGEGGADGAAAERLLHTEVVHHALLDFFLCWGEKKAAENCQLWGGWGGGGGERQSGNHTTSKLVSSNNMWQTGQEAFFPVSLSWFSCSIVTHTCRCSSNHLRRPIKWEILWGRQHKREETNQTKA